MLLKCQSKGPMPNRTKVDNSMGVGATDETYLLEILLRGKREEKYLIFSLLPDLPSLTYTSYWPNLSKHQSAREPGKWSSLPAQRKARNASESKRDR